MALKKTIAASFGIEVSDAYHRVENVSLIAKDQISFHVRSKANAESPIFEEKLYSCSYDMSGDNPIAQAYAHLKTLPEFSDAVDC